MTVVSDANEETITDRIDEAAGQTPFVIVDLAGTASKIVVMAVSRADFVIVTTLGAGLDAEQDSEARNVIRQHEKSMRRANPYYVLPYVVLLTRTNSAIRARTMAHIQKSQIDAGIPVFKSELNEREAFKAMFSFRQPLDHLRASAVTTVDKAIANVQGVSMTTKQIDPVAAPARKSLC
ncbi:cellulose biosynthesis protein BcsQ [Actimicrobium sp. GrIS 1.19]|uniref:chromosome partitioning protein ParA n=1 Tax=Actimicrobium sp. GrIS 1.19 TaxID=3071708 RepID=UPI002DFFC412|nr:cellulose biosynthesis protein BcsQ [Actimicrobium sp. GrIS 1.19]